MIKINVKQLYSLTRPARAIKDRGRIGKTAQSEMDKLLKLDKLKIGVEETIVSFQSLKNRECRETAVKMINPEYSLNDEVIEFEGLFGKPDILDKERGIMRLVKLPYSLLNFEFDSENYNSDEHYYEALGLLYIARKLDMDIKSVAIDYVFVDTPSELRGYDNDVIHIFPEHLDNSERMLTKIVTLSQKDFEDIEKMLVLCRDYEKELITA